MSNELTRKDRLCENVVKMQERFGKEVFNILPDSYILPDEFADFYSHFHSLRSKEQVNMVGKRKGFLVLLANRAVGQRVAHLAEVQVILQLDAAINVHFVADFFIELRLDGPAGLARAVFLLHARASDDPHSQDV